MFSIYSLSQKQKIALIVMIVLIFYQAFNLVSEIYHSQRIDSQIEIFRKENDELKKEILDRKRKYIKSIIPSTLELSRKENLGEIYQGEKVIIIKNDEISAITNFNEITEEELQGITGIEDLNYPKKWLLFLTGIKL